VEAAKETRRARESNAKAVSKCEEIPKVATGMLPLNSLTSPEIHLKKG